MKKLSLPFGDNAIRGINKSGHKFPYILQVKRQTVLLNANTPFFLYPIDSLHRVREGIENKKEILPPPLPLFS